MKWLTSLIPKLPLLSIVVIVLLTSALVYETVSTKYRSEAQQDNVSGLDDLVACEKNLEVQMQPTSGPNLPPDQTLVGWLDQTCSNRIAWDRQIREFEIRKRAFEEQARETPVILWMVVSLTVSGVLLAALQLLVASLVSLRKPASGTPAEQSADIQQLVASLISLRKPAAGTSDEQSADIQQNSLEVKPGSIIVRSAVSGIVVLTISLAFFWVYIIYVYSIVPVHLGDPPKMNPVLPSSSSAGGLGPIPAR
jgi:RsiW-degrading membrane proteinase PrsW (M82 family)